MTGSVPAPRRAALTGLAVLSPFGSGPDALLAGVLAGEPAFAPVRRFDVGGRRVTVAATAPGSPVLADELAAVVDAACADAGLSADRRAGCVLLLAVHTDPDLARTPDDGRTGAGAMAVELARRCGLSATTRAYTSACVAASTAVADAAAMIAHGHAERVVVAAGYLVEPDQFALFDAGRAMAPDGRVRPFSFGRGGLLLGDGVAAVVIEADQVRDGAAHAFVDGWGRAGDAYHVCRPDPSGTGLTRAVTAALHRAGAAPSDLGYVNAHGSGTPHSDAAESAGLHAALGPHAATVPVSSTKSLVGQALEAAGLIELITTVLAVRAGALPVNAGFLGPDPDCPLDVITGRPRTTGTRHALSVNVAFGGANTALLVSAS